MIIDWLDNSTWAWYGVMWAVIWYIVQIIQP
jgi:hypothetical protein